MINFAPFLFCCQLNAALFIIELRFVPPVFLHRLLPGLFFFMIVLLVTEGGLLLPLLAERLAVGAATSGCAACHVISRLIPFQSAYREGAEVWLERLRGLPESLKRFQQCAISYADEYLAPLTERTASAYANAWHAFQLRLHLEDDAAYDEATEYESEAFLRYREWYHEEVRRRYLQTGFQISVSYKTIPHPKKEGESVLAEEVFCEDLETFLTMDLIRGFMAGHIPPAPESRRAKIFQGG